MNKVVIRTTNGIFNVRMFQRNGIWYYDVHIRGSRYRRSTGMSRKSDAIACIELDVGGTKKLPTLLDQYLHGYLPTVRTKKWKQKNKLFRNNMVKWFGQVQISSIKGTDIDNFINDLRSKYSQSTVQKYGSFISRFFRWCHDNDYIVKIPRYRPIGRVEYQSKHFTDEEVEIILKSINMGNIDLRYKLEPQCQYDIIVFLLNTGLRSGELKELRREDVHIDQGYFEIKSDWMRRTKTPRSTGLIPLNDETKEILKRRIALEHEYVFTDRYGNKIKEFRSWVRSLFEKAGVYKKGYGLHSFRHTFGYRLRRRGAPQTEIQKLMRHTRITTTDMYVHLDVETLRPYIEALTA